MQIVETGYALQDMNKPLTMSPIFKNRKKLNELQIHMYKSIRTSAVF